MPTEQPAESAAAHYEELVRQSMRLHAEFNAEGASIANLYADGHEGAAAERSAARNDIAALINRLTRDRIALVPAMERLSRVADTVQAGRKDLASKDVRAAFADTKEHESVSVEAPDRDAAYLAARCDAAHRYGYEVIENGDWLILKKDAIELQMVTLPRIQVRSVGGTTQVVQLAAYDRAAGRRLVQFDGSWNQACVDPALQKDIDRLLAAFS
jgi:hypothetical protein